MSVLVHNGATLTDSASDAGSGVASVSYYYCSSPNFTTLACTPSTPNLIGTSSSASPYSVTWTGQPTNGDYVIMSTVGTDNVTNASGPSTSIPVTVSNLSPSVCHHLPGHWDVLWGQLERDDHRHRHLQRQAGGL